MRNRFITLSPATSVQDAVEMMRFARVRHVPVVRGGRLLGLVGHRDVCRHALACGAQQRGGALERLLRRTSIENLVRPVAVVTASDPLSEVARRLVEDERGCVPVVADGPRGPRLIGLWTEADVLRATFGRRDGSGTDGEASEPSAPPH